LHNNKGEKIEDKKKAACGSKSSDEKKLLSNIKDLEKV